MLFHIDLPTRKVTSIFKRLEKLKETNSLTNKGAYHQDTSISLLELDSNSDLASVETWLDRNVNTFYYETLNVVEVA